MAYRQILQRNLFRPNCYPKNAFRTQTRAFTLPAPAIRNYSKSVPFAWKAVGVAGLGIGASAFVKPKIHCESPNIPPPPANAHAPIPPPPSSSVNVYELSFGTVCGICAGVFIKKGAKVVAFVLGGVFVLLQYFGSTSMIRVDWGRMGSRFENVFYTTDARTGARVAPSVYSLWGWLVDFLTAGFQSRASFLAGLALGLRIG